MKVLVIGSGGREHALCWKLAQSSKVDKIFCAPGNAGIAEIAECVDIKADDIEGLLNFAKKEEVDLLVVGPEAPLCKGIADVFRREGFAALGPGESGAQLEGSKVYAKEFMTKYGIPTAEYWTFTSYLDAFEHVLESEYPIVIKADGLAAGKGVVVAEKFNEATNTLERIMVDGIFGDAGNKVIVECFLRGEEASFMILTDSKTVIPLEPTQDHKPIFDGDKGPNTGGTGAYCPAPVVTPALHADIMATIIDPLMKGLQKEGIEYRGVIYVGLMICEGRPYVLEFNVRFGDPETQPQMVRLESDLFELLDAAAKGRLVDVLAPSWKNESAVCVVPCAKGYPGTPKKGDVISGIDELMNKRDVVVFHAGTARNGNGELVTSGGRVLGVTALGTNIAEAKDRAYDAVGKIHFDGMHYRKDIADRAIKREEG